MLKAFDVSSETPVKSHKTFICRKQQPIASSTSQQVDSLTADGNGLQADTPSHRQERRQNRNLKATKDIVIEIVQLITAFSLYVITVFIPFHMQPFVVSAMAVIFGNWLLDAR